MEKLKNFSMSLFFIATSLFCLANIDFKSILNIITIDFNKDEKIDHEEAVKNIDRLFSKQVGYSRDVYLVKDGIAGRDKVAVVFGFLDDMEVCQNIVVGIHRNQEYFGTNSKEIYHCVYMN